MVFVMSNEKIVCKFFCESITSLIAYNVFGRRRKLIFCKLYKDLISGTNLYLQQYTAVSHLPSNFSGTTNKNNRKL